MLYCFCLGEEMELCFCSLFFLSFFFLDWNRMVGLVSGIPNQQVRNEIKKEEERNAQFFYHSVKC